MKKALSITLFGIFFSTIVSAQTTITIAAQTDTLDRSITIQKKLKTEIEDSRKYKIKITGLNSAVTSMKLNAKAFEITSTPPEILKTILPGITTSLTGGRMNISEANETLEELRDHLNKSLHRLNRLKNASDKLYKKTLFVPQTKMAKDTLDAILTAFSNQYPIANEDNIESFVKEDISYALVVKSITDELIKKDEILRNDKYARIISEINRLSDFIKVGNYLRYIDFIKKSTDAKDFVISKPFIPEKDLVELKFSFVDTYTNDTVSTFTRTLYGKRFGGIGLSFSSGFFYTEGLADIPYYLRARPDENLAILRDRRMFSDVSIGGLGHIYTNISSALKTGPAIGLAISPFDGKSRYLLGWSFLIGREKMIGISVGKAWAKQKQLSSLASLDSQGQFLPKGTSTVPTFDKIVSSSFLGLSYNLITSRK